MSSLQLEKFKFRPYKSRGIGGFILRAIFPSYTFQADSTDEQTGESGILFVNIVVIGTKTVLTDYGFLSTGVAAARQPKTSITMQGASSKLH